MPSSKTSYVKFSDKLTDSLEDITQMINEHKSMIDTIQEIALELTTTMGTLNELVVKYAGKANEILDVILPIVKKLPILPDKFEDLLIQMEKWTQKIIDNDQSTSKTIADVQAGLKTGDVSMIKEHTADLKKILPILSPISSPKNKIKSLENFLFQQTHGFRYGVVRLGLAPTASIIQ